jgi:hypothetical protein
MARRCSSPVATGTCYACCFPVGSLYSVRSTAQYLVGGTRPLLFHAVQSKQALYPSLFTARRNVTSKKELACYRHARLDFFGLHDMSPHDVPPARAITVELCLGRSAQHLGQRAHFRTKWSNTSFAVCLHTEEWRAMTNSVNRCPFSALEKEPRWLPGHYN